MSEIDQLVSELEGLGISTPSVCYVYDEAMTEHVGDKNHPERPDRVRTINDYFTQLGFLKKCAHVSSRMVSKEEICLAHDPDLVDRIFSLDQPTDPNDTDVLVKQKAFFFPFDHDTYVCHSSVKAARIACGSVLSLVDAVVDGVSDRGFAAIRPPGHHACKGKSMGFCLINNVAVAAQYALKRKNLKKVAVIDWDVHHGNGTSEILHDSPDALFISIHRHDRGKFYPGTGHLNDVGSGPGCGFTINLPIDGSFGDEEILYCWTHVVLPALAIFSPDLVLVSAGFDAAENDPLGQCRVKCETFGKLTQTLVDIQYRLILVLEGGYNLKSIAKSAASCMRALLNESADSVLSSPSSSAVSSPSSTASSVRSVPDKVPKSSVVSMVHQLTKLLNSIPNGLKVPVVSPKRVPLLRKTTNVVGPGMFLHSGGGHAGGVVRASESTVRKYTSLREALCYALIAEARGEVIPVETSDAKSWETELSIEKIRIDFDAQIESFKNLYDFTCTCRKIFFSSESVQVVLDDLMNGLKYDDHLGVLDVKLGTEYHNPDHSPNRVQTRRQKALVSSASTLGIRLTACKSLNGFSLSKLKAAKLKLMEQMVPVVRRILHVAGEDFEACILVASSFSESLKTAFESKKINLKFISSSILLVIGKDSHDRIQIRTKLIDLAHLFPPTQGEENGLVKGCSNLVTLLNQALEPSYESA